MKFILNWFNYLARSGESRARERDEAYLAQSVDISDLEYRMRELARKPQHFPWVAFTRQ